MKSVRNTRRALLLVIAVLVSCIVSPGVTHATSSYDNTVTVAHNLIVDCADGSTRDLTYNWLTYLMTDASTLNGDPLYNVTGNPIQRDYFQGEFQTTLDNTVGWSVSQVIETNGLRYVMIFNNHGNGLSFSNSGTVNELKGYATFLRISCQQYGSVQGIFMDFNNSNSPRVHANDNAQAIVNSEPQYRPFFANQTVTYPSGYEGVVLQATPPPPPPAKYVAMGDSFSSGEGNPPFEAGTANTGVNECHRSFKAYPYLLSRDPSLDLWPTAFVACSGATTSNILYGGSANGAWGEDPQIDALSEETEIITVTIGGNDVGFGRVILQCADPNAEPEETPTDIKCENAREDVWTFLEGDGLSEQVGVLLLTIDIATDSEVPVYVGGYANPFPTDNNTYCYWGMDIMNNVVWPPGIPARAITSAERSDFEAITTEINSQIEDAVAQFPQMEYVDVQAAFSGHDACSSTPWFNAISYPNNKEYSYHPNQIGQEKYYEEFKEHMTN